MCSVDINFQLVIKVEIVLTLPWTPAWDWLANHASFRISMTLLMEQAAAELWICHVYTTDEWREANSNAFCLLTPATVFFLSCLIVNFPWAFERIDMRLLGKMPLRKTSWYQIYSLFVWRGSSYKSSNLGDRSLWWELTKWVHVTDLLQLLFHFATELLENPKTEKAFFLKWSSVSPFNCERDAEILRNYVPKFWIK